jgi:putative inorganic carbon (HCO3(-)) transporter
MEFRKEVWHWALVAISDFPITGCGLGTFREVVRLLYPITVPLAYDIAHAHNIFLQTALDFGLFGLVAYLAMLQIAFSLGWKVAKQQARFRPTVIGLLSGLTALHVYGLTDALSLGSKTGAVFWLLIGLLAALVNVEDQNLERIEKE